MSKKAKIILSVLVLLIVAIGFSIKPLFDYYKQRRAQELASEASQYLEDDNFEEAWESAQAAYALFPENEAVSRVVARVYERSNPSKATLFWKLTYEISGKQSDLEEWIQAAILTGEFETAAEQLAVLQSEFGDSSKLHWMWANLYFSQKQLEKALASARKSIETKPVYSEAHFLYVQVAQFSSDMDERMKSITYLRELSKRNDLLGLKSLRNLASFKDNTAKQYEEIIEGLLNHEEAELEDKLKALAIRIRLGPEHSDAVFATAKSYFDLEQLEELVLLGRWPDRSTNGDYPCRYAASHRNRNSCPRRPM